jgi:hypothetical protein
MLILTSPIHFRYYIVFILIPAACVGFVRRLPETNGLSLEEIAITFGDEVAVNMEHLTYERRNAINDRLLAVGLDISLGRSCITEGEEKVVTNHQE